jgi:hypothetical protein
MKCAYALTVAELRKVLNARLPADHAKYAPAVDVLDIQTRVLDAVAAGHQAASFNPTTGVLELEHLEPLYEFFGRPHGHA